MKNMEHDCGNGCRCQKHELIFKMKHGRKKKVCFTVCDGLQGPTGATGSLPISGSLYGDYLYYNPNIDQWAVGSNNISIGGDAGATGQQTHAVALGYQAGQFNQGSYSVAVGFSAGATGQNEVTVAIGSNAGAINQGTASIAVGEGAGALNQNVAATAIGQNAGSMNQGTFAIAIGNNAGAQIQGEGSIAIGGNAGYTNQSIGAIALGYGSGSYSQGYNSIAIGAQAAQTNQGTGSIAIGSFAGMTNQASNSIYLNASGTGNSNTTYQSVSGFFVEPVVGVAGPNVLNYNPTTHQITYDTSSANTKHDIIDVTQDSSLIYNLRGRNFYFNLDPDAGQQIGYIAEEVVNVLPQFALYSTEHEPVNVNWKAITVLLVEELKKLNRRLTILEAK